MFDLDLDKVKFPAPTTDEEKIIFAHTRGFSQRDIKKYFQILNTAKKKRNHYIS